MIIGLPERRRLAISACLAMCLSISVSPASAQSPPATIDGPPPPLAPETVSRDDAGRATVRAIALTEPLHLDGKLDENVYHTVPGVSDFLQQVPREGAPATERTESWVMFDRDTLYIAARCWDTAPPERWVANELRRDTNQLRQNDTFGVILDTFYDRRNGFLFYTNPLGARADQAVTDEGNLNVDWNPVWDVRTGRFEGGWTVEMAIPFKSLRYRSGSGQVWGINIRRVIRRKNEWTHLTLVPALKEQLAEEGREDIMIVVGGVIPPQDVPTLLEMGAAAVFPPGTVIPDAAYDLVARLSADLGHDL